ncbi:MAG: VWA domain-containing protein [Acidobacteriota bacterium]|nr:VWA domain-containing protein [Acidobacteriota bacterium]
MQEDHVIRVGVEEVRIDAVVVDGKGRQVIDLIGEEFEVYQDGLLQQVKSVIYVSENRTRASDQTTSRDRAGLKTEAPATPHVALSRDEVRRTMVFLVDDLRMSYEELSNAREAIRKFVETQMLPGDLISIMQTKGTTTELMPFTSNKRELLARLSRIRWSTLSGSDPRYGIGILQGMAASYIIRALKEMPGRKMLILLSPSIMYDATATGDFENERIFGSQTFDQLADMALRAGVVIHTMDILGLPIQQYDRDRRAMDAEVPPKPQDESENKLRGTFDPTSAEKNLDQSLLRDASPSVRRTPLSQKTGGLFLAGKNFFVNGIGDLEEEIKGYYLISYTPSVDTFKRDGHRIYHKIRIKVKRTGCEVHTRDGFFGYVGEEATTGAEDSLTEAMFSPFRNRGLALNLASGYIHTPPDRYLVRVWLQLDGRNLGIVNEKSGGHSVSLDAVAATSDITGLVQDFGKTHIHLPVSDKEIQWIRENGMKFSLTLPAKKPGAYYVRVAVRDNASNVIGSGYQYIEMPEPAKSSMLLSSIFILNRDEDASWIDSGETEASRGLANRSQEIARRSPALRIYAPGDNLEYMAIIYNAPSREGFPPDLEAQCILFNNGVEIYKNKPEIINLKRVADLTRIPFKQRLKLQGSLPPGDYVLQLQIKDRHNAQKTHATQVLDFIIAAPPSDASNSPNLAAKGDYDNEKKTVVEMTTEELRRSYQSILTFVKFDPGQDPLVPLLQRVGNNVVSFLSDLSSVAAKEKVDMVRRPIGGIVYDMAKLSRQERHEEYQYMILPGSEKNGESWREDRSDKAFKPVDLKAIPGFIVSSGFAAYCLYLHPSHQANATFRYLGRETIKPRAHVIAFSQKIDSLDYMARYYDSAAETMVRFLVEGVIWVDPESYQITRIYTNMLYSERKSELKGFIADVKYAKARFDNSQREFWLPKDVYAAWEFPDYVYASWHNYSDYHRFSVESDYKIDTPKIRD